VAPASGGDRLEARVTSRLEPLARSWIWGRLGPLARKRRIADPVALRRRLGEPRSLLCLGNGPSSEDPALLAVPHDCLMRVNWRWRRRRFLDHPDVVLAGDTRAVTKLRPCVFGFFDEPLAEVALIRHLLLGGPRRLEYFVMRELSPLIRDGGWAARPSNGALTVAAAVALAPERLVIAGVDLYRHPDGAYPGDPRAANRYAPPHRREVEVAIIAAALASFAGELTIVGEPLREALANTGVPGAA
jgi:hypothetical protein